MCFKSLLTTIHSMALTPIQAINGSIPLLKWTGDHEQNFFAAGIVEPLLVANASLSCTDLVDNLYYSIYR